MEKQSTIEVSFPRTLVDPAHVSLTRTERLYLDLFRNGATAQCAGYFPDDFWRRVVHQVGMEQAAVRHAAIAIGAFYGNFKKVRSSHRILSAEDHSFPLRQCNKAIKSLRCSIADGQEPSRMRLTTLVTCVLFVSFGFLQGDVCTASGHLRSGSKILQEWRDDELDKSHLGLELTQVFARMHLHWSTFAASDVTDLADYQVLVVPTSIRLEDPIESLEQASNLLVHIGLLVLNHHTHPLRPDQRLDILCKLSQWSSELKGTVSISTKSDRIILAVLELWSDVIYIKATTDGLSGPTEMRFDTFHSHFYFAIKRTQQLLLDLDQYSRGLLPTFSMGTGIIPPLFFCAFKCRDWLIRREALQLLRDCQHQEGIWNCPDAALILERVNDLESEGIHPGEVIPANARIDSVRVDILPEYSSIRLWYRRQCLEGIGSDSWESELLSMSTARSVFTF